MINKDLLGICYKSDSGDIIVTSIAYDNGIRHWKTRPDRLIVLSDKEINNINNSFNKFFGNISKLNQTYLYGHELLISSEVKAR